MKPVLLISTALFLAVAAEAADAPKTACIDPNRSYVARTLNNHEVYVESSIGAKRPPVRVTTSCIHLEQASAYGFSSSFSCIGQGDNVVATLFGERQLCRVTKVVPYAPQPGDVKFQAPDSKP